MGNQFFGFSAEAFEQFVRSLSIQVFGPGVTAFGSGPDGGREASFQGRVTYPHPPTECWSGYGVIQAKCKEKAESTTVDQNWAIGLLRSELEQFESSSKRVPKPNFYVFVTNVELSSAHNGGREKAERLVKSFYRKLPLKGHAVWDANQIAAFLDAYEGLRHRFSTFITPGDVLAAVIAQFSINGACAVQTLTSFLERELRADESCASRSSWQSHRFPTPPRQAVL